MGFVKVSQLKKINGEINAGSLIHVVQDGKSYSVQFSDIKAYFNDSISLGSINPSTVTTDLPDGVYIAQISGVYPNAGNITVKEGYYTQLRKKGNTWNLESETKMPANIIDKELDVNSGNAIANSAVSDDLEFVKGFRVKGDNEIKKDLFSLGAWNASTGNPYSSTNVKRYQDVITSEMVGFHTLSNYGACSSDFARVAIKTQAGVLQLTIPANGSATLTPITFEISSEMIGSYLRMTIGNVSIEPAQGYENTVMLNKGQTALPYQERNLINSEKLIFGEIEKDNKKAVNGGQVYAELQDYAKEVDDNGKISRVKKINVYVNIEDSEDLGNDSGYFNYSTGAVSTNLNGWKRRLYSIDGESDLALSGNIYSVSNVAGAVYFDEAMNYLGYSDRVYPNGDTVYNRKQITYPIETKFVGLSVRNTSDYPILEKIVPTSNYEEPIFDSDVTLVNDKVTEILGKEIAGAESSVITNILAFGDSTTQGADLPNMIDDRWTTLLQEKIGISVTNYGFSGARAEEITFWQGGIFLEATLNNVTIPANGTQVAVTYDGEFNPFRATTVPALDVYCVLQDGTFVEGNLSRLGGFMQNGNNEINTTNGKIRFVAKNLNQYSKSNNLMIVSFGANNTSLINNGTQSIEQLKRWYSDFAKKHKNVLIWSQNIRSAGELSICLEIEDYLEKEFGRKFCNMRKYLASTKALSDAEVIESGFVRTEADTTAVTNGLIPPSFKFSTSSAHLNELGHNLQANFLYSHIALYCL